MSKKLYSNEINKALLLKLNNTTLIEVEKLTKINKVRIHRIRNKIGNPCTMRELSIFEKSGVINIADIFQNIKKNLQK